MPDTKSTPDQPPAAAMPLGAKRLFILGCLAVLCGVVAGRFVFVGLLLAVAGLAGVAVALSYGTGETWFGRMPRAVAAAGALWIAVTAGYGGTVSPAASRSGATQGLAGPLLLAGWVAFALVCGLVLAAIAGRLLGSRNSRRSGNERNFPSGR